MLWRRGEGPTALYIVVVAFGTDVLEAREALEALCSELGHGDRTVVILVKDAEDGRDDIVSLFLVIDFILEHA